MWVSRKKWSRLEDRLWRLEVDSLTHKERLDNHRGRLDQQREFEDGLQRGLLKQNERLATLEGRADARDVVELPIGEMTAHDVIFGPAKVHVPFSTWAQLVSRALRIVGSPEQGPSAQQLPAPETKRKGRN